MGNCLVTKLKGVVDNPNLNVLGRISGEIYLPVNTTNGYVSIEANIPNAVKITVLDEDVYVTGVTEGGTVVDNKTCLLGIKGITYPGFFVTPNSDKVKVFVDNKYELSAIALTAGSSIDFSDLKYSKVYNFVNRGISKGHVSDSPSTLRHLELSRTDGTMTTTEEFLHLSLQYALLNSFGSNLTGDFINFTHMTSATYLNLTYTDVTGSLNAFVRKQIENGRLVCDRLEIGFNPGHCTFNDVDYYGNPIDKYLKWDNTKMYLCKVSDNTVIDEDTI